MFLPGQGKYSWEKTSRPILTLGPIRSKASEGYYSQDRNQDKHVSLWGTRWRNGHSKCLTKCIASTPLKHPNTEHYEDYFHEAPLLSASLLCGLHIKLCIWWKKAAPGHDCSLFPISPSSPHLLPAFISSWRTVLSLFSSSLFPLLQASYQSVPSMTPPAHTWNNEVFFFTAICTSATTGSSSNGIEQKPPDCSPTVTRSDYRPVTYLSLIKKCAIQSTKEMFPFKNDLCLTFCWVWAFLFTWSKHENGRILRLVMQAVLSV